MARRKDTEEEETMTTEVVPETTEAALLSVSLIGNLSDVKSRNEYSPLYRDSIDKGCTVLVAASGQKYRLLLKDGAWFGRWIDDVGKPGKDADGKEIEIRGSGAVEDVPIEEYAARFGARAAYFAKKLKKERGY